MNIFKITTFLFIFSGKILFGSDMIYPDLNAHFTRMKEKKQNLIQAFPPYEELYTNAKETSIPPSLTLPLTPLQKNLAMSLAQEWISIYKHPTATLDSKYYGARHLEQLALLIGDHRLLSFAMDAWIFVADDPQTNSLEALQASDRLIRWGHIPQALNILNKIKEDRYQNLCDPRHPQCIQDASSILDCFLN